MSPFYGVHAAEGIKLLDHALFRRNPEVAEGARIRHLDRVAMGFEPVSLPSGLDSALQPLVDGRGSMVVFDGRIDNADELCPLLGLEPSEGAEAEIVRAAFAAWGEGCFSRLLGDWAL